MGVWIETFSFLIMPLLSEPFDVMSGGSFFQPPFSCLSRAAKASISLRGSPM